MANKDEKLSTCMITQAWLSNHWDSEKWNDDDVNNASLSLVTQKIVEYLSEAGAEVVACYGITHDRDTREVWNDVVKSYVLEPKFLHGHWVVKFKNRESGLSLANIAVAVGLAPQFIERAGKGRYAYDNMLSYLIHAKDADKFSYSASDVVSVVKDEPAYSEIYAERKSAWEKGRAKKTAKRVTSDELVEELYEKVITGEVTHDQILLTDDYYAVYSRNIDKFEKGFKAYTDRKILQAVRDLEAGKFNLSVLYFQGQAGHGKTATAVQLAQSLVAKAAERGERWSICQAAATNPVDDYNGEEILIMDDLRGNAMRATDWLKLLDPYNSSPNSARYKNKRIVSRYIFITSIQDVYEFFYYTKNAGVDRSEPLDQFMRRILALVKVVKVGDERHVGVYPQVSYNYRKRVENDKKDNGYDELTLHHGFYAKGLHFTSENFGQFVEHLFDDEKRVNMLELAQLKQDALLADLNELNDERDAVNQNAPADLLPLLELEDIVADDKK